ncbi:MAG: UPFUPF0157-like protein [Cryobacterium sp.]|nr:UPFUPF0157-like protein [Cryobacterium sp.]
MKRSDGARRPDVSAVELIGGPEPLTLELHSHDERWVGRYLEHRRQILTALAANVGVEHIGSTSVPGLAAKPIIDIVVTVDDITAEEDYLEALLGAGYELRTREPGHRLVRTQPATSMCTSISRVILRWSSTCCSATGCARTRRIALSSRAPRDRCSGAGGTT